MTNDEWLKPEGRSRLGRARAHARARSKNYAYQNWSARS
jgi:hypothetical protein